MDDRDGTTWVVLELTRLGEQRAEDGTLAVGIRDALGCEPSHPVFVPSAMYSRQDNEVVAVHLMEGYAFVASGLADTTYFNLETSCPMVRQVLSVVGSDELRALSTLPNSAIEEMRQRLRSTVATDLEVGMQVTINEGVFTNLTGKVMALETDEAVVSIELRSLDIVAALPRVFLTPQEGVDA